MGLLTAWYEVHYVGAQGEEWNLSFWQRLLIAGRALWFYAIKLIWPVNFTFIYPRWVLDVFDLWQWVWPSSFVITALYLWWFRERLGRGPITGLACFSVTLFPALGFFDIYPMRYSFVADHFQYLASMGLIALIVGSAAYGVEQWHLSPARSIRRRFELGISLGVLVLLVLGVLTWRQTHVYKDVETLWRDTIDKNPQAWLAHNNLGVIYRKRGELRKAANEYNITLKLKPDYAAAHNNLGYVYFNQGLIEKAIEEYRTAIKIRPNLITIRNNLGKAYFSQGRLEEALKEYNIVAKLKPNNVDSHYNLGVIYQEKEMFDKAIQEYQKVINHDPKAADAHNNLGVIYAKNNLLDQAILEFKKALLIDPDFREAKRNLRDIYK